MGTTYHYIDRKSMGFARYEIQNGDFVLKAYRQPSLEQLDAPASNDHDEMEHDKPPTPPASVPMDIPMMFTSIMGHFDAWEGHFNTIDPRHSTLEQSH